MCRIFGFCGPAPLPRQRAEHAQRLLLHGGPDQQGQQWGKGWCLGANRLAILGGTAGAQPYSLGKSIYAVLNGEIYNHGELRSQLAARGVFVEQRCDGAIIPGLYAEFGRDFVHHLDGMFAIAVVDLRWQQPRLLAACDHLAIKSIYYHRDPVTGNFLFASELEALAALAGRRFSLRLEQIDGYLSLRSALGDSTPFEDVWMLRPGEVLQCDHTGQIGLSSYDAQRKPGRPSEAESAGSLRAALREETTRLLDADVPVCLVTSGGLDSSLLTAVACETEREIHCFNIGYRGEWPADERHYAREVALHTGAILHPVELDPADIPDVLARMIRHLGQPNSAPHCVSAFALFESIRRCGYKVAIAGEGADELFGGYRRFASDPSRPGWIDEYLDELAAIPKTLREGLYHPDYLAWSAVNEARRVSVARELIHASESGLEGLLNYELQVRFPNYILRRVDHLSMAHALEIRVPYCQARIREIASRVPAADKIRGGRRKVILYEAAAGLLPASVLARPKQGFTLPITEMIRPGQRLFEFFSDVLGSQSFKSRGIFAVDAARGLLDQQTRCGNPQNAQALWSIAICELWLRQQDSLGLGSTTDSVPVLTGCAPAAWLSGGEGQLEGV